MSNPEQVTRLDLSSQSLKYISGEAFELNNLEELIIDNNTISSLPLFLNGKWLKLKKISASNNGFDELDIDRFWNFPELIYLDLSHNILRELSNYRYSFPPLPSDTLLGEQQLPKSLKVLLLNFNVLESVSDYIGAFTALEQLNLSYNVLITIDKKIWSLEHLENLNLSNNNLRFIIGANTVIEKSSLKQLNLSYNKKFWTIAWLISKIPSLEYLDVNHCNFHFGLPSVKKIYKDSPVKTLLLGNCGINTLYPAMGYMPFLEELDLSYNNIKEVPRSFRKLTRLQKLDLRGNLLSEEEQDKIKRLLPNCKISF
jgi:Leucine-rich repeat (LRR) protein